MANLLATYPASLSGSVGRLRVLDVLSSGGSLVGLDQMVSVVCGAPQNPGLLREGTVDCPRMYAFKGFDAVYLFVDGISTVLQAEGLVNGYTGYDAASVVPGRNPWLAAAAEVAYDFLTPLGGIDKRWYLNGYSAGGAIVHYLGNLLYNRVAGAVNLYLSSFGAPAAFASYFSDGTYRGGDFRSAAWFTSDDPVPYIPPQTNVWLGFWGGRTWRQANQMATFLPIPNGRQVDTNFNVTGVLLPTQVVPPVTEAIAAWLQARNRGIQNSHSILTYLTRFRAASALIPDPDVPNANQVPPPPVVPMGPRMHNAQADALVALVVHDARRQNLLPLVIPHDRAFNVFRKGELWAVYFGDVQVYLTPSKRGARIFKNAGNRFLQRFQKGPVVDPGQLIAQFSAYMALASLPDGPFSPPLNISP